MLSPKAVEYARQIADKIDDKCEGTPMNVAALRYELQHITTVLTLEIAALYDENLKLRKDLASR